MYIFHSHQSILLLAEDHLVMVVHVPKVLCYGEAAEAVTRVVKISGPGHTKTIKQGSDVKTLRTSKAVQLCSVCVCVLRWCGTDLPGLSRRPPVGFWQHRRMYSCKACCSNIHRCWLSSDSPEQTHSSVTRGGGKKTGWSHRKFRPHFQHENVNMPAIFSFSIKTQNNNTNYSRNVKKNNLLTTYSLLYLFWFTF